MLILGICQSGGFGTQYSQMWVQEPNRGAFVYASNTSQSDKMGGGGGRPITFKIVGPVCVKSPPPPRIITVVLQNDSTHFL